jgi:hypothetical protein
MVRGSEERRKTHGTGIPGSMKTGHDQSYVGYRGIFIYVRLCAFAEIILFDLFRLFSLDVRQEHEAGEKHLGGGQHRGDLVNIQ